MAQRGNPNLKNGFVLNPNGRPKGSKSIKQILRATTVCSARGRHPIAEMIRLADIAEDHGQYELAANLWKEIHKYCEPQKKAIEVAPDKPATPEESLEAATAAMKMIKELENGTDGEDTPTISGDQSGLVSGNTPVQAETDSAAGVRPHQDQSGENLCSELHSAGREDIHNGDNSHGDCPSNP